MDAPTPERLTRHGVDPKDVDPHAVDVIERLHEHGYEAFLVGGCVRDFLCGMAPKDFDVATNATPEEVKAIFRRARLVGRRFPIAHVRYGRNIIEVSTFRQGEHDEIELDAQGMIIKDHAFGSIAEDAFRRDFTVNALYYDPLSNEVIDYVGGVADIEARHLRFIGDPEERLAEDPVRMLRAMRFAAKLGFAIDDGILAQLPATAERLSAIPKARLFDEFLKLFMTGFAAPTWQLIKDTPLRRELFPASNPDSRLITAAMRNTDDRVANDQPVTPGFLIAVLLWEDFQARLSELSPQQQASALQDAAFNALADQQQSISIPRRYGNFAREIWSLQDRLVARNPRSINRLLQHKRFRASFDFLSLRADDEPELRESRDWWDEYQQVSHHEQDDMVSALPRPQRRRRRRRKPKSTS